MKRALPLLTDLSRRDVLGFHVGPLNGPNSCLGMSTNMQLKSERLRGAVFARLIHVIGCIHRGEGLNSHHMNELIQNAAPRVAAAKNHRAGIGQLPGDRYNSSWRSLRSSKLVVYLLVYDGSWLGPVSICAGTASNTWKV